MHIANFPILGHLFFESMAAMSFMLQPQIQLQDPEPSEEAVLICQSYAGSLLATDVLCVLFLACRPVNRFDDVSAMLAGSLAVYHVFPIRRAWARMKKRKGKYKQEEKMMGGPSVHLIIHGTLLSSLVWSAIYGRDL